MKIVNFSPYPVYPPKFGGQIRTYSINNVLSSVHEVFLFSFVLFRFKDNKVRLKSWGVDINNNFQEYNYVFPPFYVFSLFYYLNKLNPYVISSNLLDISSPKKFKNELNICDIVQVESPYFFKWVYNQVQKSSNKIPIILSEHNVEYLFEKGLRPNNYLSNLTNSKIKELENFAVNNADRIFAVSEEDAYCLEKIYSINHNKIDIIPNGVDTRKFNIIHENKDYLKKNLNLYGKKIILFSGSKHIPNFEALKLIQKMAHKLSHIDDKIVFLIAGSVGDGCRSMGNIYYTGKKDDISPYFQMADIAVNPMISGSGTNLKMLEYLASGLPTITTTFGARGLGLEDGKHAIIADINDFTENILNILNDDSLCNNLKINGRKLVEENFDWRKIAEKVMTIYESLLKS